MSPTDPPRTPPNPPDRPLTFAELGQISADILQRMGPGGYLALFWAFFPLFGSIILFTYINSIGDFLRGHAESGIAVYIAGFVVLAGCGLLPTYASAILGGWAFGFATGYPAALAGFVGASLLGRLIAGAATKDRVEQMIREQPKWQAVRDALIGGSPLRRFGIVTLLRLPPNSPFALTNFILTTTKVPLFTYTLGTLIGMAPRTGIVLWIASTVSDKVASDAAKTKPLWLIIGGVVLSLIVLGVLGLIANRALQRLTGQQPSAKGP